MTSGGSARPQFRQAALRPPDKVMRLARMGCSFPTRLSFMRSLIRRLNAEGAEVARPVWKIGGEGYGHAVYSVELGGDRYSLVAVSTPLDPAARTDRVIAQAWDTAYVLYDGMPGRQEIERIVRDAPQQEAARFRPSDLVLSRANRSVRMFEHVAGRLAAGEQPDPDLVREVGYLMRTTAVYGNGKFGIADRDRIAGRPALAGPFQAEMLCVWLIREFTHDLVEHVSLNRMPSSAVPLAPPLRRHLGIGNATGLGMAPFLVNHPLLLNNWILARETALARVRAVERTTPAETRRFRTLLDRACRHVAEWQVADRRQGRRILGLLQELNELRSEPSDAFLAAPYPWDRLYERCSRYSIECQELVAALAIEAHGALVDDLADQMASSRDIRLDPAMSLGALRCLVAEDLAWALEIDFSQPGQDRLFWYVSEEKLEPRLGDRFEEAGADREMPLDIARQVQALSCALDGMPADCSVAEFLMRCPEHREIVRRVQSARAHPYAEIQDNLIGEDCLPIDMLRCKLAFFGASKFDPKSDRWTRITLYQGAPTRHEVAAQDADDWWLPALDADLRAGP